MDQDEQLMITRNDFHVREFRELEGSEAFDAVVEYEGYVYVLNEVAFHETPGQPLDVTYDLTVLSALGDTATPVAVTQYHADTADAVLRAMMSAD